MLRTFCSLKIRSCGCFEVNSQEEVSENFLLSNQKNRISKIAEQNEIFKFAIGIRRCNNFAVYQTYKYTAKMISSVIGKLVFLEQDFPRFHVLGFDKNRGKSVNLIFIVYWAS